MKFTIPSPIQPLVYEPWQRAGVSVAVKRDDLIHPRISGNKYRKLVGYLQAFDEGDCDVIISMGGPWSNHLHALAKLCQLRQIPLLCLIRGPEPVDYSQTLQDILTWGAKLQFLNRTEFRELRDSYLNDSVADFLQSLSLPKTSQKNFFIPEGGYGAEALVGMRQMALEIPENFDHLYLAVGTATTMAGLVNAFSNEEIQVTGIQAVQSGESHVQVLQQLVPGRNLQWKLCSDFIGKGFARSSSELEQFMWQVHSATGLITEPVYTGKALYGLNEHICSGDIKAGEKVLFIHTGGLQGLRGYSSTICNNLAHAAGF